MKTVLDKEDFVFKPPELGCVLSLPGLPGGSSKVYDRSPYGNIGTITGATWKRLPSGFWCLYFDGTDDTVNCGNASSLRVASQLTVEFWQKSTSLSADHIPASHGQSGSDGWYLIIRTTGSFDWNVKGASGNMSAGGATGVILLDTWHHIVCTYDGVSGARAYVDAVAYAFTSGDSTGKGDITWSSHDLKLGAYYNDTNDFTGYIALLRVYNRILGGTEINNHFEAEKNLFGVWQV